MQVVQASMHTCVCALSWKEAKRWYAYPSAGEKANIEGRDDKERARKITRVSVKECNIDSAVKAKCLGDHPFWTMVELLLARGKETPALRGCKRGGLHVREFGRQAERKGIMYST